MRQQRTQDPNERTYELPLMGRRNKRCAPNSMKFLANIEGVRDYDGHVRGANGMRWKVAS